MFELRVCEVTKSKQKKKKNKKEKSKQKKNKQKKQSTSKLASFFQQYVLDLHESLGIFVNV